MKVAIIVFSPTGNTFKVGQMLEERLISKHIDVQLYNFTGNDLFSSKKNLKSYLKEHIKEHDLLCIGSPVYAHHLHYNVKNIIKALPKPKKGWAKLAVPFVTYGAINSGVALYEAAKLLTRSGRLTILGMKINAFHCMTALPQIKIKINKGMPGVESLPFVKELADKITQFDFGVIDKSKDITKKLNYQKLKNRMKAKIIFKEKFWHKHLYPKLNFNHDKCQKCEQCIDICPVNCIKMTDNGPILLSKPSCIHCAACILNCPFNAIEVNTNWVRLNNMLENAINGRGPLVSNENPKSLVYS
ncbi:MAG: EFR1 family ferrodoxin [Promethearchaeota archaeon]